MNKNEEKLQQFTDLYSAFHETVRKSIRQMSQEDRVELGRAAREIQEAKNDHPWKVWEMANILCTDTMFWHEICYHPRREN